MVDFRVKNRRWAAGAIVTGVAALAGIAAAWTLTSFRPHAQPSATPVAQTRPAAPAPPQAVQIKVERGETLQRAVQRIGVSAEEARLAVQALSSAMDVTHIKAGLAFEAAIARPPQAAPGAVQLVSLSLHPGPATQLTLSRTFDGALSLKQLDEQIREETKVADGQIQGSLYESAEKAGATSAITAEVVKLFAHKLDFQRDIQPGDEFKLVFDRKVTESGKTIETGDLQYAELHGVKFYRFQRGHDVEYVDQFGKNIKGFLLRTPVDATRVITSLFGLRKHPILGYTRAHQGIDFGASEGTPILAAGDGTVLEARRWAGYGNWLRIRHNGGWDTGYGHISRYARGIRPGVHVRQGQVVAYVGETGLATGPHLHYEIWKNGQRVNPLSTKVPQGTILAGAELRRFKTEKTRIDALVDGGGDRALAMADTGSRATGR